MAEDTAGYGEIYPNRVYDLRGAARALGQSTRWVMDNLIDTDEVMFRKQGDYKGIPGWVLIQWVEGDLRRKSEWKEPGAEPESEGKMPTKSASRR